ncbi:TIM-barrel domain-containing protein [Paramaledivibacter caminithermalis]|jgi:alpha-glucosidase|uniref:Alpha-glucosidase n=1 Tax=Paramaledivibacter caminithermalis (strain DSM 15212 / CIP 107654 / DViRD3) TaxID=1121301 RepID=A0A1M6LND9_PARC5|nr:TIM-barrel domain-containing protein [Paramaledivibacter caminithermalis]SHJ72706.1 alpha-glucosidase [Paramaledivibacter caminithermalis DSM 15212]
MIVYKIIDSVMKYRFGNPVSTDAVVFKGNEINKEKLQYFTVENQQFLKLKYKMHKNDIVLGLGENLKGINKRGGVFESYCSDDADHTPDKKSLYGAHNFLVINGVEKFGIFIDYPGRVLFDIGFTHKDELEITINDKNLDIYIINGKSLRDIINRFLKIIGKSYVPPKWAFGFQQSRWSYQDAKKVEEIANNLIKNDIPCDSIYLDIDYMEDFKDFTISKKRFPNFKSFVKKMKDKGFRLIPIIDAGVKIEDDYEIYKEGIENGYFCVDEEGNPFIAAVWPGKVHFPDFLNKEARRWFGLKYKKLIDLGIDGFWNDMNEPAIFYTERGLKEAVDLAKESKNKNLNIHSFFNLKDSFENLSNNTEDYKSFYHNIDGELVNHDRVHNLYGYNMTRAAAEGFKEIEPNKRFLIFSRASYIGMHRYGGIWTGDNHSWWEHILLNIKMMPSLNMCGFLYSGADTGGFSSDANAELIIRWTQFSLFTPLFRNHSAMGTRNQEPYAFDTESTDTLRNTIRLRYSLIPYIYSEYMKAVKNHDIYFAPLSFEYDDKYSRYVEDQLLVGDSLMVTPIYKENAIGRYIWMPEEMLLWKASDYNYRDYDVINKGHQYIDININEIPIFIRKNKILVLGSHANNIEKLDNTQLNVIAFVDNKATYTYYDDDGITYDFDKGIYSEIVIDIEKIDDDYRININNKGNKHVKKLNFEIIDLRGNIIKKSLIINRVEKGDIK